MRDFNASWSCWSQLCLTIIAAKADLIKYMEQAWTTIAAAKIQVLKTVMMVCWIIPAHYTHVLDLMTHMGSWKTLFLHKHVWQQEVPDSKNSPFHSLLFQSCLNICLFYMHVKNILIQKFVTELVVAIAEVWQGHDAGWDYSHDQGAGGAFGKLQFPANLHSQDVTEQICWMDPETRPLKCWKGSFLHKQALQTSCKSILYFCRKKTEFSQKEELTRVSTLGPSLQMTYNVKENSQGVINLEQLDHVNPNAYGSSISDQATTSASDIHRSSSSPPSQLLRSSSLSNCSLILVGFLFLSWISTYEEDNQLLKTVVGHVWSQQWAELSITRLVRYMEWSCGWCD